jgi:hypothetical protein
LKSGKQLTAENITSVFLKIEISLVGDRRNHSRKRTLE